ncbi:MAG TPA: hypothetical protein VHE61_10655 [Opitutaceae bacterium]|nr:hypothetical protein [Opitutaceae bacterium]
MREQVVTTPAIDVAETEFHRLLGYPRGHVPGERSRELSAGARDWYARRGRPWVYRRELEIQLVNGSLLVDRQPFHSAALRDHLRAAGAGRAVLFAASAGVEYEEEARRLWQDAKPDEYFFLETYAAAVVEHLVAATNGRVCAQAEADGFSAIPHYSPGYDGWDVAEQNALFDLLQAGRTEPLPGPLDVLPSGMLKPKKSLLGIIGLAARMPGARPAAAVPCLACSLSSCQFRRAPYRHAPGRTSDSAARSNGLDVGVPTYSVNPRALQKWSRERVRFETHEGGEIVAWFRFDGTTCSNMGRPLAFDYRVVLRPPASSAVDAGARPSFLIAETDCRPVAGDEGHRFMCEYLRDAEGLMAAIATPPPLLGRPLDDVLTWRRTTASTGCHCDADSRAHKWGLALEAIHFALASHPPLPGQLHVANAR